MRKRFLFIILLLIGIAGCVFFFNSLFVEVVSFALERNLNKEFWDLGFRHLGIETFLLAVILIISFFVSVRTIIYKLAVGVLAALFFVFLLLNTVNIPISDDYYTILEFSNNYFFTNDFSEKISLLFSFNAESRSVTLRIVLIILHFITGWINFKVLIVISNICLLIILLLFYKSIRSPMRWELVLIISLLLFQFAYYDAIVWATDAFYYQFVVVFFMTTLYLIDKKSIVSTLISMLAAILAVFTFGNGLLVFPVVILYYLIQKRWNLLFSWVVIALITTVVYFQQTPANSLMVKYPLIDYFIYSCCFLGSAFQFMYKLHLPFVMGLLVWVFFIILTIRGYYKINFFIYGLILFLILSSMIAGYFRMGIGFQEPISNRYAFFSVLAFSASIIALFQILDIRKQKIIFPFLLAGCIAYHLLSGLFFFPEVTIRKNKLEIFMGNLQLGKGFNAMPPAIPKNADIIVRKSMKRGIYFPYNKETGE